MNAIAELQPTRLPFHPAVTDRFGIDKSGWKALVEAIYPLAKTPDSVVMALSYCKARKLDPFKKPVHIVPMWDAKGGPDGNGGYVETVWPGISEVRTTAFRTGQYSGCDETEFGPEITQTFVGQKDRWENRRKVGTEEISLTVTFPEWARMTVYRELGGRTCKFVGPKVYWMESYASQGKLDIPNTMWADRPIGQIEKCAEAAALRKAFPEEIGNDLTAEEMEGRRVEGDFGGAEIVEPAAKRQPPTPPKRAQVEDAEVVDASKALPHEPEARAKPAPKQSANAAIEDNAGAVYDPEPILAEISRILDTCTDDDDLEAKRAKKVMPLYDRLTPEDQEKAKNAYRATRDRIASEAEAADVAANEAAAAEAGDPVGPDERGHPDDDGAVDDRPADQPAVGKKPEKMDAAELEAHIAGYIETMTDADALKKRWYMDDELREILDDKTRQALRTKWKARMDELRAAEGQG